MKRTTLLATLAALLAGITAASGANQTSSVNFQGRSSDTGNPATPPLAPTDRAGVVAVSNWNNVDDQYGGNGETLDGANNGTSVALNDSTGAATTVTVTFTANDSWYNDVACDAVTTPNAKMMNGIIKRQGVGTATEFTFNNLTDAQYDLYVYFNMNGDGVRLNLSDNHYVQNFYVVETHEFTDTSTFIECKNTNPNGPYDVGNYVHFKNLATYGGSSLTVLATYISGADGNGIAGMQLINVGPPVAPPPPPAPPPILLTQPVSGRFVVGDTPSFSILPYGSQPAAQWFKNGTAIPDATNNTYRTPPLTAADDQAKFRAVVSNSSGSVTSSVAVVTIGHLVFGPGVKREFYSGHVRADLEDPGFTDPPTSVNYLPSIEAPINVANNFAERLSTLFIPSVTGDYVFFVCSDDDSDLFLSTDDKPANKHLIAQETGWSTSRQWVSSAGASDLDS